MATGTNNNDHECMVIIALEWWVIGQYTTSKPEITDAIHMLSRRTSPECHASLIDKLHTIASKKNDRGHSGQHTAKDYY